MEERINQQFTRNVRDYNKEDSYRRRHNNWIQDRMEEKRLSSYNDDKLNSSDMNIDESGFVNMEIVSISLNHLFSKNYADKTKTKNLLKSLRKELSKNSLDMDKLQMILFYNNQQLLLILTDFLFDFKNSEIQLEVIWILNNLCIFCQQFNFKQQFFQIHSILINFMQSEANFSNSGVKNLILEKYFSLVGNLILYEENIIHFYISNNILYYLIKNLNSSVRTLRAVVLLTINNMISAISKTEDKDSSKIVIENSLFFNKDIMYYYKFIFTRLDISKNFEECYEFLWLMNTFAKANFELFTMLFIKEGKLCVEFVKKILYFILIDKLQQPALRIMGNLLLITSDNYDTQYHLNDPIVEMIIGDKSVFNFILIFLSNLDPANKYSLILLRDIIWFIKNLCIRDPIKIRDVILPSLLILYKMTDRISLGWDENMTKEINENLLKILYIIFSADDFYFFLIETGEKIRSEDFTNIFNFIISYYRTFTLNKTNSIATRLIILEFVILLSRKRGMIFPDELAVKIEYVQANNM